MRGVTVVHHTSYVRARRNDNWRTVHHNDARNKELKYRIPSSYGTQDLLLTLPPSTSSSRRVGWWTMAVQTVRRRFFYNFQQLIGKPLFGLLRTSSYSPTCTSRTRLQYDVRPSAEDVRVRDTVYRFYYLVSLLVVSTRSFFIVVD
jgi:hypothetical protein